jgi:hypothetical protein
MHPALSPPAARTTPVGPNHALRALVATVLLQLLPALSPGSGQAWAAEDRSGQKVTVADPFIDLHTGPGRGYPKFYSVDRGGEVEILKRRTDWFQVKTDRDIVGWVARKQMANTLSPSGEVVDLRDPDREDGLGRRWMGGVSGGDFGGASLISGFGGYAFTDNLSVELTVNQILGDFSNAIIATIGLKQVILPEWRFSPYIVLGAGGIFIEPRANLGQARDRNDQLGYVGGGLQFFVTRRFMLRTEYRNNIIFTSRDDNEEIDEWKYLGFGLFF